MLFEMVLNDNFEIMQFSDPLLDILGYTPNDLLTCKSWPDKLLPYYDEEIFVERYRHIVHGAPMPWHLSYPQRRIRDRGGRIIGVTIDPGSPMIFKNGHTRVYYRGRCFPDRTPEQLCEKMHRLYLLTSHPF